MLYIKQFDAIRAIAVLLVVYAHWLNTWLAEKFAVGLIGVDLFFVLSGFLITRILLQEKKYVELNPNTVIQNSKTKIVGKFIVRRALRIFPHITCYFWDCMFPIGFIRILSPLTGAITLVTLRIFCFT